MIQSGAQQTTMQPAPGSLAWAFAFVGAHGTSSRVFTGLQPATRYSVTVSGRVQSGLMRFAVFDADQQRVAQLDVRPGDIVSTQVVVTSDAAGQVVLSEVMGDARNGEYQVWMQPVPIP